MRLKIIFSILVTGLMLCFINLSAQTLSQSSSLSGDMSKVKINQLSDQQLITYWKEAQSKGISENGVYQLLAQRGLPEREIAELKRRMSVIQNGSKNNAAFKPNQLVNKDSTGYGRDTTTINTLLPLRRTSRIYGYNFFSNPDLKNSFPPDLRVATPKGYVLGPDDDVMIFVSGQNETNVTAKINPEGSIEIPHAGLLYVNGLTVEQAEKSIKQRLQRIYPAISSGKTQVSVALGSVRTITVSIMGQVIKPGSYPISSLSNIVSALYLSGGPTNMGSLRNIQVIRGGKSVYTIDLYPFFERGIFDTSIRLEDQDIINIPVYKKRVAIAGEVKIPGLIELKDTETLEDLIQYAGGYSDLAYKASAKITRIGDKERSVKDVLKQNFSSEHLMNADSVSIGAVNSRVSNRVVILGAVNRPGEFELSPGLTLTKLIANADGLRDDAFLSSGNIKRTQPDLEKTSVPFDLNKVMSGGDILLQREDTVTIISKNSLANETRITLGGNVKVPGIYIYRRGMKLADAISMAGGFTEAAAIQHIEISRLIKDHSDIVANQLSTTLYKNVDSILNNQDALFSLEPNDNIFIPRLVNYHALGNINITGEVVRPGSYPQQRRDETAPDFIAQAGGATPIGSLTNAQVFRNGLRVNMDVTKSSKEQIMMAGDSIYVPRENSFVQITGAVNNPQLISYTGKGFKYYINATGGTTDSANLKKAYVKYPDGTNQPVKRFLFFRSYPSVAPGSKITIPLKPAKPHLGIGEISGITSALTAIITLIALLIK